MLFRTADVPRSERSSYRTLRVNVRTIVADEGPLIGTCATMADVQRDILRSVDARRRTRLRACQVLIGLLYLGWSVILIAIAADPDEMYYNDCTGSCLAEAPDEYGRNVRIAIAGVLVVSGVLAASAVGYLGLQRESSFPAGSPQSSPDRGGRGLDAPGPPPPPTLEW